MQIVTNGPMDVSIAHIYRPTVQRSAIYYLRAN